MKDVLIYLIIFGAVAVIAVAAFDKQITTQAQSITTGATPGIAGDIFTSLGKALPALLA